MSDTVKVCVITREFTEAEFENGEFSAAVKRIVTAVGGPAREGVTANDKTDLWFDVPPAGLNAKIDKLNEHDDVSLAHYRDGFGQLYPRI